MQAFIADLRHGFRLLVRSPGFTAVAVLSLAVGIGANTAIFSLMNALLLRPLPVERPNELVSIYTSDFSGPAFGASSFPDYLDFKAQTTVVSSLAAQSLLPSAFALSDRTERAFGIIVTGNYFDLLGIRAADGRALQAADDDAAAEPVVVLSDRFWQRLGGSAGLVGQPVRINGQPFTVAGIAQSGFSGVLPGFDADFWVPSATTPLLRPGSNALTTRGSRGWMLIGRLVPGVTLEQAQAAFNVLAVQHEQQYPDTWRDVRQQGRRISVTSSARLAPNVRGPVTGFMALLMTVVGLVLLIACANVANLLLARAAGRTREVAVRLALGAGRGRLIRQLLTESLVLSALAGATGLLLAAWSTRAIAAFRPPMPLPVPLDPSLDVRVLAFALVLSIATGVAFGLMPALHATRPDLVPSLKLDTGWAVARRPAFARLGFGAAGRFSAGQVLVVGQVALSLLLLVAAGLFIRTLQKSQLVDLGFDPDRVVVTSIDLAGIQPTQEKNAQFYQALLDRLSQMPQAEHVSLASLTPLGLNSSRRTVTIEGYEFRQGEDPEFHINVVTPGYFETLRIPIVKGRAFTDADRDGGAIVTIVNETFARRFWPDEEPLGKRIKPYGSKGPWAEVIGVTEDGHYVNLLDETLPYFFLPLAQGMRPSMTVLVRTRSDDSSAMIPAIRSAVRELNANVSAFDQGLLAERIGVGLLPMRFAASVLGVFGAVAMALAAIGLYGVLAHGVNLRRREIGVRVALGAEPKDVQALFVSQGMRIVAIGMAIGWAAALAVTRLLASFLYGVSPTDSVTFLGTSILLAMVAFAAAYLPSRRAARLDPILALRQD